MICVGKVKRDRREFEQEIFCLKEMSEIPTDKDNFLRFICFFIDVGTETVLKVFYYYQYQHPSVVTFPIPRTPPFAKQLQTVFFKSQYYNVTNATGPDDFDINTLITLLRTLFSGVLPTPTNGWGRHPAANDYSISADLLRLRSFRNDIVAHINRASLSRTDFEKLWKTVEEILKRLVQLVDPGNEEKLEETFEAYRQKTIGASTAEKYVNILKKQLEELTQTFQDFNLLWKDKHKTPYMRYIRLLLDGGRSLLTAYLNKLVKENNVSLQSILLEKQAVVLEKLNGNQAMMEQVYPRVEESDEDDVKTVNKETTSWDLSVLAKVTESLFITSVHKYDLDAIRAVKEAKENYAYTALHAITSDERFHAECEDLLLHLSHLARTIGDNSIQEFNRFKDEYRSPSFEMTSEKVDDYLNQLKRSRMDIKDITDIHKECVGKLRTELSTKGKIDVNVNENFELEIMIQLACQDLEKQKEAEAILYNFMKAILADPNRKSEESPDLPEVRQTLDTIRGIPTVKLTCVKKSCLLITVESNLIQAIVSLLDFVDSSKFQNQLDGISTELKDMFDEVFILKGHFTLESIQQTLVRFEEKTENNSVKHDAGYAQTRVIIDTCEHMKKEKETNVPSQSCITIYDRRDRLKGFLKPTESGSKTEFLQTMTPYQHSRSAGLFQDSEKENGKEEKQLHKTLEELQKKLNVEKEMSLQFKLENESLKNELHEIETTLITYERQYWLKEFPKPTESGSKTEFFQTMRPYQYSRSARLFQDSEFTSGRFEQHKEPSNLTDVGRNFEQSLKIKESGKLHKSLEELLSKLNVENARSLLQLRENERLKKELHEIKTTPLHNRLEELKEELKGEKNPAQRIKLWLEKEKIALALSLKIAEKKLAELKLERSEGNNSSKQVKRERRLSF